MAYALLAFVRFSPGSHANAMERLRQPFLYFSSFSPFSATLCRSFAQKDPNRLLKFGLLFPFICYVTRIIIYDVPTLCPFAISLALHTVQDLFEFRCQPCAQTEWCLAVFCRRTNFYYYKNERNLCRLNDNETCNNEWNVSPVFE